MTKEEAIDIMMESINSDNRQMGIAAGISAEELEKQIAQSQPTLAFMMENIYNKLIAAGIESK